MGATTESYENGLRDVTESTLLSSLAGWRLLVTGGTGMVGRFLVDALMRDGRVEIVMIARDSEAAKEKFRRWVDSGRLFFVEGDLAKGVVPLVQGRIDAVIHLASNTHPKMYAECPISTIAMNVMALKGLLDIAVANPGCRVVYASTVEIYGQNRGDVELFDESYCGYIDCNTLRAGYPESKRCGEALCRAYQKEKGVDFVIPRLARIYGPTLRKTDTKALSQFIGNALKGQDIVLKSSGDQYFSYLHVADAVSGILTVLLKGDSGEAYNVADAASNIRLKDLAELIAKIAGRKVIFDLPDAVELAGFSTATKALMDNRKIMALGWKPRYDIQTGISETLKSLKEEWS
jgi:nucleoside-diphosphate-sugar epimerase